MVASKSQVIAFQHFWNPKTSFRATYSVVSNAGFQECSNAELQIIKLPPRLHSTCPALLRLPQIFMLSQSGSGSWKLGFFFEVACKAALKTNRPQTRSGKTWDSLPQLFTNTGGMTLQKDSDGKHLVELNKQGNFLSLLRDSQITPGDLGNLAELARPLQKLQNSEPKPCVKSPPVTLRKGREKSHAKESNCDGRTSQHSLQH